MHATRMGRQGDCGLIVGHKDQLLWIKAANKLKHYHAIS